MVVPRLLLVVLALVVAGCGRFAAGGPPTIPEGPAFQALIASPLDPEGNTTTTRFDSATGRMQRTLAPGNATAARFAGPSRISYLVADRIRSEDDRGGSGRTEAASPALTIAAYAWSSGGALAYLTRPSYAGSARGAELVIERPGVSAATVALTPASAWGGDQPQLQFSPDGRLLLLVDAVPRFGDDGSLSTLQVRRLDGRLVFDPVAAAAGPPSDAAWGGSRKLYFRDARGVNVADLAGGAVRTILPGVRWYHPDTSPGGRTVVFELRDGLALPRLQLLDTATDTVVAGYERDGATLARFVSPDEIWFHEVRDHLVSAEIRCLDTTRLTESPTGLSGFATDVRGREASG